MLAQRLGNVTTSAPLGLSGSENAVKHQLVVEAPSLRVASSDLKMWGVMEWERGRVIPMSRVVCAVVRRLYRFGLSSGGIIRRRSRGLCHARVAAIAHVDMQLYCLLIRLFGVGTIGVGGRTCCRREFGSFYAVARLLLTAGISAT